MHSSISQFLVDYAALLGRSESVFKKTQTSKNVLDPNVLNEIRYSNRALASALELCAKDAALTADSPAVSSLLVDANKGLCIAINDAVDNNLLTAKAIIASLNEAYFKASIAQAYGKSEYQIVILALTKLEAEVADTREFRADRVIVYEKMSQSDELATVVRFIKIAEITQEEMRLAHEQSITAGRVEFWAKWAVFGALAGAAATLVAVFVAPLANNWLAASPK